jgi:conjugal transfer ATP-binding protein TraC
MLPFGFDMEIQKFLSEKRGRVVFSENAISMMPVSAEWLGTNPQVPMISPKGQLFGIDLFANKAGGFNAFVIGMTGSGKSVWMQWIALNYYLSGNKIWIIDIGGSYEKVCPPVGFT